EDHQTVVDHGAGAEPPNVLHLAQVVMPEDVAGQIVAVEAGRAVPGDDALAVADWWWGGRGEPYQAMTRWPSLTGDGEQNGFVLCVVSSAAYLTSCFHSRLPV